MIRIFKNIFKFNLIFIYLACASWVTNLFQVWALPCQGQHTDIEGSGPCVEDQSQRSKVKEDRAHELSRERPVMPSLKRTHQESQEKKGWGINTSHPRSLKGNVHLIWMCPPLSRGKAEEEEGEEEISGKVPGDPESLPWPRPWQAPSQPQSSPRGQSQHSASSLLRFHLPPRS